MPLSKEKTRFEVLRHIYQQIELKGQTNQSSWVFMLQVQGTRATGYEKRYTIYDTLLFKQSISAQFWRLWLGG